MHNNNSKGSSGVNQKLSKKRLLPNELEQYRRFGKVDYSQNWLELFGSTIVSDLFTILDGCSSNQLKAECIEDELRYYGFEAVGLGTNVFTMANPAYPGVVFKFALDENGLADNFNDGILMGLVNDYLDKPRYTRVLARHPSGIVSVQERKVVIREQDRLDPFRRSITKTLEKLSRKFLIVDLSPTLYQLNYGIDRNGDWCFVDASDLYPLANIKSEIRCNRVLGYDQKKHQTIRCHGRFVYNHDFSAVVCDHCGVSCFPMEIRPKDKGGKKNMMNALSDGYTAEEREAMRKTEVVRIAGQTKTIVYETPDPSDEPYLADGADSTPAPAGDEPEVLIEPDDAGSILEDPDEPEDDDETIEVHPTPEAPKNIFVPVRDPASFVVPKQDEDDGDEDVEVRIVTEPSAEASTAYATPLSDEDDPEISEAGLNLPDEPEDDESSPTFVNAMGDTDGEDEPDDAGVIIPDDEDDVPAPDLPKDRIEWSIRGNPYDPNDATAGIYVNILGDIAAALEAHTLPIYVSIDNGETWSLAVAGASTKRMLEMVLPDIIDERNAFRG